MKQNPILKKLDNMVYDKKEVHQWALRVKKSFDDLDASIHYREKPKKK